MTDLSTFDTILSRRSIRSYRSDPLPAQDIRRILEAARQAPSAANRQPVHFVIVRDPERKRQLGAACAAQHWIADADLIVVCLGNPPQSPKWYQVDAAIAMEHLVLAATALGYGTCWIGAFSEPAVRQLVGAPDDSRVIALTPLGIPIEHPDQRPRKPASNVFSFGAFGSRFPAEIDY